MTFDKTPLIDLTREQLVLPESVESVSIRGMQKLITDHPDSFQVGHDSSGLPFLLSNGEPTESPYSTTKRILVTPHYGTFIISTNLPSPHLTDWLSRDGRGIDRLEQIIAHNLSLPRDEEVSGPKTYLVESKNEHRTGVLDYSFVNLSTDPERDSPQRLSEMIRDHSLSYQVEQNISHRDHILAKVRERAVDIPATTKMEKKRLELLFGDASNYDNYQIVRSDSNGVVEKFHYSHFGVITRTSIISDVKTSVSLDYKGLSNDFNPDDFEIKFIDHHRGTATINTNLRKCAAFKDLDENSHNSNPFLTALSHEFVRAVKHRGPYLVVLSTTIAEYFDPKINQPGYNIRKSISFSGIGEENKVRIMEYLGQLAIEDIPNHH